MVTMEQALHGLKRYIDSDILPHLDGYKRLGVAVYMTLAMDGAEEKLAPYMDTQAIKMLGVTDSEHHIDIDRLADVVSRQMQDGQLTVEFPLVGSVTFRHSDIQRLTEMVHNS